VQQFSASDTIVARSTDTPGPGHSVDIKSFLIKIYPAGHRLGMIPLSGSRFVIGRGNGVDLDLGDSLTSRHHASIERVVGQWMLTDMGSTNGTFVNDARIDHRPLQAGDLIRVGSSILKFLSSTHVEAQYHEAIYQMMVSDALTGAHNRRFFTDALERELARSWRYRRPTSLVMFDIDHFKSVNDRYGHLAGDAVLREVGHRIQQTVRKDEVFARYGGEEFAIILPETPLERAAAFAERIRQLIGQTAFAVDSEMLRVTVSLGVAQVPLDRELTPVELVNVADLKLYEAKQRGRNRVMA
jgi:diguanylate cyclase (GGDEF)-like protein